MTNEFKPQPVPQRPAPNPIGPALAKPETPQPQVVVSLSDTEIMLKRQAALGIRTVDDFKEGDYKDADRQHPKAFPDIINGRKVRYLGVDKDNPTGHPLFRFAAPVTRDTVPGLPDVIFNSRGNVQEGDILWCVVDQEVYEKYRVSQRKLAELRMKTLNHEEKIINSQGGGYQSGVKAAEMVEA